MDFKFSSFLIAVASTLAQCDSDAIKPIRAFQDKSIDLLDKYFIPFCYILAGN